MKFKAVGYLRCANAKIVGVRPILPSKPTLARRRTEIFSILTVSDGEGKKYRKPAIDEDPNSRILDCATLKDYRCCVTGTRCK